MNERFINFYSCRFTASLFAYGISNMYDTFSGTIHVNLCISSSVSMVFAWSIIPVADR
jgi:hypothetical protein